MSPSTTPSDSRRVVQSLGTLRRHLSITNTPLPVRAASFYLAIGLPFVYLPVMAGGLSAENGPLVAGLLVANVLTLVLGHSYGDEDASPRTR
jgi:hypothetical protein